jgi:hypothetical protein
MRLEVNSGSRNESLRIIKGCTKIDQLRNVDVRIDLSTFSSYEKHYKIYKQMGNAFAKAVTNLHSTSVLQISSVWYMRRKKLRM